MDYSDETEDSQRPARGYSSGSQWPALGAGSSHSTSEPTLASLIASESGAPGGKPPKPKKDRFKIDMPYLRRWKFHSIPIRQSPYGAAFYGNVNELNNEDLHVSSPVSATGHHLSSRLRRTRHAVDF